MKVIALAASFRRFVPFRFDIVFDLNLFLIAS